MRVAVLGAGSLGTIIDAYLSAAGYDTELIARTRVHVDALNQSGAKVSGTTDFSAPVRAITPNELSGTYDLVLLLTKQLTNVSALQSILPYLNEASIVCSLQNGVPEADVAAIVGRERVIAGSVEFGAELIGPGQAILSSEFEQMKKHAFQIGELDGQLTDRIQQVRSVLDVVGGTYISENLVGTKWSKLLINAAFSGLSAALNGTYGDVLDNDISARAAAHIVDETIKVGHVRGIRFGPMMGFDLNMLELHRPEDVERRVQMFRSFLKAHRLLRASMLQDLEKRRPTEIDYINGVIPKQAEGTGISTPYNSLVVQCVKEAEAAKTIPDFETNLRLFADLLNQHG